MIGNFEAILWDCDGVLIDSEIISCGASVEFMRGHGHDVTLEKFLTDYMGKSRPQILASILAETGLDLLTHYADGSYDRHKRERFRNELKEISGVRDILAHAGLPMAVASGSDKERLALTLDVTNLADFFGQHVYSAEEVAKGKPAPDIFLHAAKKLGVAPEKCLVIEDGIHGIHAAKAAGMEVWAFLGGSHIFPTLREQIVATAPDRIFSHMPDIYDALFSNEFEAKRIAC